MPAAERPEPNRPDKAPAYPFLDLLRFGAALLVMFGHTRGLFFVGIRDAPDAGILTRAFYLATSLHHEAVVIFFVLSGFLVGAPAAERIAANEFHLRDYFIDRFTRIFPVLIPALVVTALAVVIGEALFPTTRLIAERPLFPGGVADGWTWSQVPCHLLSLQNFACRPWLQNPPLWSLGYEWVLYFLGPLLFLALGSRGLGLRLAGPLACIVIVWALAIMPLNFARWGVIWLLGAVAGIVVRRRPLGVGVGVACLLVAMAALPLSRLSVLPPVVVDLILAISLAAALCAPAVLKISLLPRLAHFGAGFSYSLYSLHVPLGILTGAGLIAAGWPDALQPPGIVSLSAFAITALVLLAASWLFSLGTEAYTGRLRRRLRRRASVSSTQRAAETRA